MEFRVSLVREKGVIVPNWRKKNQLYGHLSVYHTHDGELHRNCRVARLTDKQGCWLDVPELIEPILQEVKTGYWQIDGFECVPDEFAARTHRYAQTWILIPVPEDYDRDYKKGEHALAIPLNPTQPAND